MISSSTCSRCSGRTAPRHRRRSPISTSTPPAASSPRWTGWPARTSPPATPTADREPPVFDPATHTVTMPEPFKQSYQAFMATEFWRMDLPAGARRHATRRARSGGRSPRWCSARTRRSGCTPPARRSRTTLHVEGTEEQKRWAKLFVDRQWGSTMVLTEPDAGSDVGAGRTRADPAGRRLVAHRGRQALHHQRRARPGREHRPLRAGPAGRRRGAAARAPRACRCSSCRSSTSTPRPASWASATASSPPTSSTRWASRPPPPAS